MRSGHFLTIGILLGALVVFLLMLRGGSAWDEAHLIGMPLGLALAVVLFAARFPCRTVPLATSGWPRVVGTHLTAAVVSAGAWVFVGGVLSGLLDRFHRYDGAARRFLVEAPGLVALGTLVFLLAVAIHYLVIALEATRDAEVRGVERQVLAREAELRALRAQVDPHFLFNSLNSIATLTAEDPAAARRMCLLLAGFLRRSLAIGGRTLIPLGEELDLVAEYLEIEKVRFGPRLTVDRQIEDACLPALVPPFLLQPLVENAVRHGIAQILEGGTLGIEARRAGDEIRIAIDNPRDPERAGGRGAGLGIENVRGRIQRLHGAAAHLEVATTSDRFRVSLALPFVPGGPLTGAAGAEPPPTPEVSRAS